MKTGWIETDATVASSIPFQTKIGTMYSVVFTYKVESSWYGGTFTTGKSHRKGDTLSVFYDPKDPDRNNLVRREGMLRWFYIAFFTLLAGAAIYLVLNPNVK